MNKVKKLYFMGLFICGNFLLCVKEEAALDDEILYNQVQDFLRPFRNDPGLSDFLKARIEATEKIISEYEGIKTLLEKNSMDDDKEAQVIDDFSLKVEEELPTEVLNENIGMFKIKGNNSFEMIFNKMVCQHYMFFLRKKFAANLAEVISNDFETKYVKPLDLPIVSKEVFYEKINQYPQDQLDIWVLTEAHTFALAIFKQVSE